MSAKFEPLTLELHTLELLQESLGEAYADTDPLHIGVLDRASLESASTRPLTAWKGQHKYSDPYSAAAALGHSIVNNHPFFDGNKRSALLAMVAVLDRCNIGLTSSNEDAFEFMLRVTQHQLLPGGKGGRPDADDEVEVMADWLRASSRKTPGGERQLTYRELIQALRTFGVQEELLPGNKVNLIRQAERDRTLRSQIGYIGRRSMTVEPATVRKVRTELELDEAHGIDHLRFYESAPPLNKLLRDFRGALDALAEYDRSGARK